MTTLVTRLYETTDRANAAADTLRSRGLDADAVTVVSAPAGATAESLAALLKKVGLVPGTVRDCTPHLLAGHALVAASAPTGRFFKVRDAMEAHQPMPLTIAHADLHISDEAVFRAEAKPFTLLTGKRFGGNPFLLLTGTYWGGPQRKLLTGTYWGGPQRKLLTGTRWSGNKIFTLTGTRWGGFWPRLLTGTYWGGPVKRIIRKEKFVPAE